MEQILIIEDDEMLNAGLCYNLQAAGYTPAPAYDLKTARDLLHSRKWDLILLDVNLPDGDGFTFAGQIRRDSDVPVIFLTAQDMDEDMVKGFEAGADDYITKPFNIKVVLQRIRAVLNRCGKAKAADEVLCGNLRINLAEMSVQKGSFPLALTPTEFKLLKTFLQNQGQVLTREIILEKLWDCEGNFVDEHTLTINVSRLRSKISDEQYTYIKTVYGVGYHWIGDREQTGGKNE
ncbi:response regulator transcription factor [Diplocloster hominis]|uniref:response regulator transcription factor n=1 Tax=Diplocloster hominis TaxID=3079010 RepID=UPI0031BAB9DB